MAGRGLEQDKESQARSFEAVESLLSEIELRADEESLRTVFDAIDQGLAIAEVILDASGEGVDYRILAANAAFADLMGRSRAELLNGKTARELIPTLEDFWPRTMGQVAVTGEATRFEKYSTSVDRRFEVKMFPVGNPSQHRIASIYNDITERRRAERTFETGQRIKAYLLKLSVELRPIERATDIMSAASEAVARELNVAAAGYIEVAEDGETAVTGGQFADGRLPALAGAGPCKLSDFGEGIGVVLRSGQDLFVPDILAFGPGPEGGSDKTRDFKLRAAAAVPLMKNGKLVAFFYATHHEPRPWESWEQEIFRQTAEWTWAAVERARAEAALRESLDKYRTLFDSIDQGYVVIELLYDESGVPTDFRYLQGNRVFEKQTGLTNYQGKARREIFAPSSGDSWLKFYARVAETGEPARLEDYSEGLGRWYSVFASRVGDEGSRLVNVVFDDITERKETDVARRIEEERHAFRWKLSDAIRPLEDPIEIKKTALRVLGEQLGVDRAFYGEVDAEHRELLIEGDYACKQGESVAGRYSMDEFAWIASALEAERPVVIDDLRDTPTVPDGERGRVDLGALIASPLVKKGHLVATLCVTERSPRAWTPLDVEFVWHTGERTWAALVRAQAEAALRASEEKYRGLFNAIDQGYALLEVLYDEKGAPRDLFFIETNRVFQDLTGQWNYDGKTAKELNPNLEEFWLRMYASVAETGQPVRFDRHVPEIDKWFTVFASRLGEDGSHLVSVVFDDITERKRTETDLREREERKAYLLRLSDAIRPLFDPIEIQGTASRLLGEELRADRTFYVEMNERSGDLVIARDYVRDGIASMVGRYPLETFAWIWPSARRGRPTVVGDVKAARFIPDEFRQQMIASRVESCVAVPMVKEDRLVGALCVTNSSARGWAPGEVERVQETAERTWAAVERAQAEAALRASEEKYRTLFDSIDNAIAVVEVLYNEQGKPDNLRFIETNAVFNKATGLKNPLGKTSQELLPNLDDSCIEKYAAVAETGRPVRFESYSRDFGCWMDIFASRLGGDGSRLVNVVFDDITVRKRAETELRDREERKAYQLRLSDALRPLLDPLEIQGTASRLLGEELHADRALYVEIDEAKGEIVVARDFAREGVPSLTGRRNLEALKWISPGLRRSRPTVVNDAGTTPFVQEDLLERMLVAGLVSFISVPLVKGEQLVGVLCVASAAARIWTPSEVERVQDTADRTSGAVEHARAEAARRASEEKYGTLFNFLDQGIAVVEVLYNDAGDAIDLRFIETNRVWEQQNGVTNAVGRTTSEVLPQLGL